MKPFKWTAADKAKLTKGAKVTYFTGPHDDAGVLEVEHVGMHPSDPSEDYIFDRSGGNMPLGACDPSTIRGSTHRPDIKLSAEQLKELADVFTGVMGDAIGTYQAVHSLAYSLESLNKLVKAGEYEKASALGYGDIASEFIWLQRCLGALQSASMRRDSITQDLAKDSKLAFEDVAPVVETAWEKLRTGK